MSQTVKACTLLKCFDSDCCIINIILFSDQQILDSRQEDLMYPTWLQLSTRHPTPEYEY